MSQDEALLGRCPLPLIGWVSIRLAELLYEWNRLAEARQHLADGLARAELGGDVQALIAARLLEARLELAAGDSAAAAVGLERARPLVEQAPFPDWVGRFERLQLECWLAQDRLRAAVDWADAVLLGAQQADQPASVEARLALARVLIVKGDGPALARALELLEHLLDMAQAEGRLGVEIETLALQALAHARRGLQTAALTCLEHALRLAEPQGYVRLFADLGLPLARLLQEARDRAVLPEYVATLLAGCGGLPGAVPAQAALPEPLTGREQEILKLLAAGLTNREIAATLVISPETVKKHTGSIYGKMGVGSRVAAIARARQLHLLD